MFGVEELYITVLSLTFAFIDAIFPSIFIQFCLIFLASPLPRSLFAKKRHVYNS